MPILILMWMIKSNAPRQLMIQSNVPRQLMIQSNAPRQFELITSFSSYQLINYYLF